MGAQPLCGTSLGRVNNTGMLKQFDAPTIWNALPPETTWGIYFHDVWQDGQCYTAYTFYTKARRGELPAFTYLEPKWGYGLGKPDGSGFSCGDVFGKRSGGPGNDDHPPTWVGPGEAFLNTIYEALTADGEAWQRTLLVIMFDEHGGPYDHVDPG